MAFSSWPVNSAVSPARWHRPMCSTIALGSFPAPVYYNFNIGVSPHTLVSEGTFYASGNSYDWHPAINANTVGAPSGTPLGEIFTTWMSTDPPANVNVQLRAGGGIG